MGKKRIERVYAHSNVDKLGLPGDLVIREPLVSDGISQISIKVSDPRRGPEDSDTPLYVSIQALTFGFPDNKLFYDITLCLLVFLKFAALSVRGQIFVPIQAYSRQRNKCNSQGSPGVRCDRGITACISHENAKHESFLIPFDFS